MTAHPRGLLDTSVVINQDEIALERLPVEAFISAMTLAELASGPHAATDPGERALRQRRLQEAEATFEPLPFDAEAARAHGQIYGAVRSTGRSARGRVMDLQIAAVAVANGLPLYTRNPDDLRGLGGLVTVVAV